MGLFSRGKAPLTVTYRAKSESGGLDQVLSFRNDTETALLPTLRFVARDHYGRELPHVVPHSVLGMDRGAVCVPPGSTGIDVLAFTGEGNRSVRGVEAHVVEIMEAEHPPLTQDVTVVMIDLEQRKTYEPADFWGVGLANPNDVEVEMRVVLIQHEPQAPKDDPRQVVDVVEMTETVTVAPQGHQVIWLPEDVRGQYDGVLGAPVPALRL
ncbi:hypothetical protein [Aeromicrobium marinum]|uniref:hypothetical protein n=1 Tax=Aeromicrobium marinum TaxID=219314 RepID=UPI0001BCC9AF|nr:hypothetical protein [Aeromicrobium marinum]